MYNSLVNAKVVENKNMARGGLVETKRAIQERLDQLVQDLVSMEEQLARAQAIGLEPRQGATTRECSHSRV